MSYELPHKQRQVRWLCFHTGRVASLLGTREANIAYDLHYACFKYDKEWNGASGRDLSTLEFVEILDIDTRDDTEPWSDFRLPTFR